MKKVLKYLLIILITYLSLVFVYFEFGRPCKIGLLEYNDDLYEKNFLDHSFTLTIHETEYEFSKKEIFHLGKQKISGMVRVIFSQEPYWALSAPYHLSIKFEGKREIEYVIEYFIKNGATLNKERGIKIQRDQTNIESDFYYWLVGNQKLYTNYNGRETERLKQLALWREMNPSAFFRYHLYFMKIFILRLPNFCQPDWAKKIKPKI